jgi:hypothetical protein
VLLYLQALSNLVEDLSNIKYKQEQLSTPDEILSQNYQFKNETLAFFIFCLEKLDGPSKPVLLFIKEKLQRIIRIINSELEKETFSIAEQKLSSLSLERASSTPLQAEFRCKIFTARLEKLREIEQNIDRLLLKTSEVVVDRKPSITLTFEEYIFFSGKFRAKNAYLEQFFKAFVCLGDKHFRFSGPVADSKCYLKKALFNAQRDLNTVLEAQYDAFEESEGTDAKADCMDEQQPLMIISPLLRRSSASLNLLELEGDCASDESLDSHPPRSPSAQRFL